MIDFEEDLRRRLHTVAETQRVPLDLRAKAEHRAHARGRRAGLARGAAVAVVLVATVAASLALRNTREGEPRTSTAAVPPAAKAGWEPMADAPISPRFQHLAIAMGDRILVWGGYEAKENVTGGPIRDGAIYDVKTNSWTRIAPSPLPAADSPVGVWTGKEAIVIVSDHLGCGPLRAAAYNPSTNRWRSIAEPPVDDRIPSAAGSATWTGTQVILTGVGEDPSSTKVSKVALLDPASGSWRAGAPAPSGQFPGAVFSQAIWTGSELVGFGLIPRKSPADRVEPVIHAYSPSTDR